MIGYKEFVEWDRGKRLAFTFVACSKNATEKFLKDYRITDLRMFKKFKQYTEAYVRGK